MKQEKNKYTLPKPDKNSVEKSPKYCITCEYQCCGHIQSDGPLLTKKERKRFKAKYGECYDEHGRVLTIGDSEKYSLCIFFVDNQCLLSRAERPIECLAYPFMFIYKKNGMPYKRKMELNLYCPIGQSIITGMTQRKTKTKEIKNKGSKT